MNNKFKKTLHFLIIITVILVLTLLIFNFISPVNGDSQSQCQQNDLEDEDLQNLILFALGTEEYYNNIEKSFTDNQSGYNINLNKADESTNRLEEENILYSDLNKDTVHDSKINMSEYNNKTTFGKINTWIVLLYVVWVNIWLYFIWTTL